MSNPFEAYAQQSIPSPVKAKHRAAEKREARAQAKMVPTPMERKLREQQELLASYRRWRKEVRVEVTKSNAAGMAALVKVLRKLTAQSAWDAVEHVRESRWLLSADSETQLATLRIIADVLVRCNVRDGLPPFDDPLPWQPDGPYQVLRKILAEPAAHCASESKNLIRLRTSLPASTDWANPDLADGGPRG